MSSSSDLADAGQKLFPRQPIAGPRRLPFLNALNWRNQHQDVERQIVTDHVGRENLEEQCKRQCDFPRQSRGKEKAECHPGDIGHRVDNAIAGIAIRHGHFAIAVDNDRRVFENFPSALDQYRRTQRKPQRPFLQQQPAQPEKDEAMDDMAHRVPIGQMLAVLRALHDAVPQLY